MAPDQPQRNRIDDVFLARACVVALILIGLGSALVGMQAGEVKLIPCLITAVTGHNCPGCGMTRACLALTRGEFGIAWQFNPFAYLIVPLAVAFAVWPQRVKRAWQRLPRPVNYGLLALCLIALCIRWLTLPE